MAITRTQIARQLYKDGKRVGLKGGKDAARSDFGQAKVVIEVINENNVLLQQHKVFLQPLKVI